jgi:hypothetical protein
VIAANVDTELTGTDRGASLERPAAPTEDRCLHSRLRSGRLVVLARRRRPPRRRPMRALEHALGLWALRFLIASLAITPLRQLAGVNLLRDRRALGLLAFYYALLHLTTYLVLDQGLNFDAIWAEFRRHLGRRSQTALHHHRHDLLHGAPALGLDVKQPRHSARAQTRGIEQGVPIGRAARPSN